MVRRVFCRIIAAVPTICNQVGPLSGRFWACPALMRDAFPCWRDEENTPPKEIRNEIYSFVTVKVRRLGLYRKIKDSLLNQAQWSRQSTQAGKRRLNLWTQVNPYRTRGSCIRAPTSSLRFALWCRDLRLPDFCSAPVARRCWC